MNDIITITGRNLVIDYRAREWCKIPYPGHPKGCPNYDMRDSCPPRAYKIEDFIELSLPMYLVLERFNLLSHTRRMKYLHPNWSERQIKCVLYWQNGVNGRLTNHCIYVTRENPGYTWTICPEAMGINVIKTVKLLNIPIKTHPTDLVIKVGLVGFKLHH